MAPPSSESMLPSRRRDFMLGVAAVAILGPVACAHGNTAGTEKPVGSPADMLSQGFGRLKRRIKKHVGDDARKDAAVVVLDAAEERLESINLAAADWRSELALLPGSSTMADRDGVNAVNLRFRNRMSDALMEACKESIKLREHITEPEWNLIFAKKNDDESGSA
jgi:hypothetical protein